MGLHRGGAWRRGILEAPPGPLRFGVDMQMEPGSSWAPLTVARGIGGVAAVKSDPEFRYCPDAFCFCVYFEKALCRMAVNRRRSAVVPCRWLDSLAPPNERVSGRWPLDSRGLAVDEWWWTLNEGGLACDPPTRRPAAGVTLKPRTPLTRRFASGTNSPAAGVPRRGGLKGPESVKRLRFSVGRCCSLANRRRLTTAVGRALRLKVPN